MKPISVCTGGEWYQFPSHFHLPSRARLQFISDGFGGILPQHFAEINGTWVDPPQEFNDRNTEVRERYIPLEHCDYLVLLIDRNKVQEDSLLRRQLSVASEVGSVAIVVSRPQDISESHSALEAESSHRNTFRVIAQESVVAPEHSTSALYRAFYVPFKSATAVKFKDYVFFERE